jgi:DNA-binding NarL/FixJ family response regulator
MNHNKAMATARQAEILRRVLAGESHGTIAAEQGVTAKAISQAEQRLVSTLRDGRFDAPEDADANLWGGLAVRRKQAAMWLRRLAALEAELKA